MSASAEGNALIAASASSTQIACSASMSATRCCIWVLPKKFALMSTFSAMPWSFRVLDDGECGRLPNAACTSAIIYQHGHRLFLPLHLCQHRLGLGQPEGHVHGAVHFDGSSQDGTGLFPLTGRGVQRAEATVAVGHERAQAQFVGQGEGLLIVGFSLLDIKRLTPHRNITEEAQGIRLVPASLVLTGDR